MELLQRPATVGAIVGGQIEFVMDADDGLPRRAQHRRIGLVVMAVERWSAASKPQQDNVGVRIRPFST